MVPFQFQYYITNLVACRTVDVSFLDSRHDLKEETEWEIPTSIAEKNAAFKKPEFSLNDYILDEDYELYDWDREPTKGEITQCSPHIDEILEHYQPHGVIYLGKITEAYKDPKYIIPETKLLEPDARLFKHTQSKAIYRHVPTLTLTHPRKILYFEYKVLPLRKEARKLQLFIEKFL